MRYFALDCLSSFEQSFVTTCETQEDVQNLHDNYSDYIIEEITEEQYNTVLSWED